MKWTCRAATFLAIIVYACSTFWATPPAEAMSASIVDRSMTTSVVRLDHEGRQLCTGTVVKQGLVLTAAHCFENVYDPLLVTLYLWSSGVGVAGSQRATMTISGPIEIMANYSPGSAHEYAQGDIALVPVSGMPPWAEPLAISATSPRIGAKLTQFGYGNLGSSVRTDGKLRKSKQGAIERRKCPNLTGGSTVGTPRTGSLCTYSTSSKPWQGDSGGPLLWWSGGAWKIIGVFNQFGTRTPYRFFWAPQDHPTRAWLNEAMKAKLFAEPGLAFAGDSINIEPLLPCPTEAAPSGFQARVRIDAVLADGSRVGAAQTPQNADGTWNVSPLGFTIPFQNSHGHGGSDAPLGEVQILAKCTYRRDSPSSTIETMSYVPLTIEVIGPSRKAVASPETLSAGGEISISMGAEKCPWGTETITVRSWTDSPPYGDYQTTAETTTQGIWLPVTIPVLGDSPRQHFAVSCYAEPAPTRIVGDLLAEYAVITLFS